MTRVVDGRCRCGCGDSEPCEYDARNPRHAWLMATLAAEEQAREHSAQVRAEEQARKDADWLAAPCVVFRGPLRPKRPRAPTLKIVSHGFRLGLKPSASEKPSPAPTYPLTYRAVPKSLDDYDGITTGYGAERWRAREHKRRGLYAYG